MIIIEPDKDLIRLAATLLDDADVGEATSSVDKLVRLILLHEYEEEDQHGTEEGQPTEEDHPTEEEIARIHAGRLTALQEMLSDPPLLSPVLNRENDDEITIVSVDTVGYLSIHAEPHDTLITVNRAASGYSSEEQLELGRVYADNSTASSLPVPIPPPLAEADASESAFRADQQTEDDSDVSVANSEAGPTSLYNSASSSERSIAYSEVTQEEHFTLKMGSVENETDGKNGFEDKPAVGLDMTQSTFDDASQPDPPGLRTQADPPGNYDTRRTNAKTDSAASCVPCLPSKGPHRSDLGDNFPSTPVSVPQGGEWNCITDVDQRLLHESAFGNLSAVQDLLSPPGGANIDAKDRSGRTCLYYAIVNDNVELVRWLVKSGASLRVRDKYGRSPLHLRDAYQSLDITRILLEEDKTLVNIPDNQGQTPLLLACASSRWDVVEYMTRQEGTNVCFVDPEKGNTPLHYLVCSPGTYNDTDVSVAEIIELVISKGAEVNKQNASLKQTPLHLAVKAEASAQVFKLLLDSGADVNLQDVDGHSPLSLAKDGHHVWELKLMQSHSATSTRNRSFLPAGYHVHGVAVNDSDDEQCRPMACVVVPLAPSEWATSPMAASGDCEGAQDTSTMTPCRAFAREIVKNNPNEHATEKNPMEILLELKRLKVEEVKHAVDVARAFCPVGNKRSVHWKRVLKLQEQSDSLDQDINRHRFW